MRRYRLVGADGRIHESECPGVLGGNRRGWIYGTLGCSRALAALRRPDPPYRTHRVFFASEVDAIAAGFRPCGHCLPERYREWARGPAPGLAYPWRRLPGGLTA